MKVFHIKSMYEKIGQMRGLIVEKDPYDESIDNISLLFSFSANGVERWMWFFCYFDRFGPWYKRIRFSVRSGKYTKEVTL